MNQYQSRFSVCIADFATLGWAKTEADAEGLRAKEQAAWPSEQVVILDHEGVGEILDRE